jgi:hypothetical protein
MQNDQAKSGQGVAQEHAPSQITSQPSSKRYARDWEFIFRAAEILIHCAMDCRGVPERRRDHFKHNVLSGSAAEAERFSPAVSEQADWFAQRWCGLFDDWSRDPKAYVFADGYALLFFLCVLHANMNVVLRGQVNADWRVATSLSRWRKLKGDEATTRARLTADQFIARISEWAPLKAQYPKGLREDHREAICQHYGFPTEYIDVTFAYDVALFFAEDWNALGREPMPECGAIYALPIHTISRHSLLITLPPAVMRPNLQFGKFLHGSSGESLDLIERHKFRYRHASWPIARGLSRIGFESPPRLAQYLYPPSDPLEAIASELRWW